MQQLQNETNANYKVCQEEEVSALRIIEQKQLNSNAR